ncbi:hypothetical protein PRECH8_28120 [Insulibacter thermoxylanivorax]|uniref:Uncharacterized protein n=1 Tax=Insulibacter thermoxylanivorax TaxID=2749268 RepID=A0A916VHD5_9BACL|nr:hypothetical protein PRECH8_28120 [Insulibacter thermoxylanivorax]
MKKIGSMIITMKGGVDDEPEQQAMGTCCEEEPSEVGGHWTRKVCRLHGMLGSEEHTDDPCMLAAASGYASDLMLIITICFGSGYAVPIPILTRGRIR